MKVEIIKLNPEMPDLQYATPGSAALDLYANIEEDRELWPGEVLKIPTGVKIHLATSWLAGFVLPRSGLGSQGLVLGNLVGLIDSDYQGELIVTAWNRNEEDKVVIPSWRSGKAFAQYLATIVIKLELQEVEEFSNVSLRGEGGFGSTDGEKK